MRNNEARSESGIAHLLFIIVIAAVLAVAGFAGWQVYKKQRGYHPLQQTAGNYSANASNAANSNWNSPQIGEVTEALSMPSCQGTNLFSSPVVDPATIGYIDPLGHTSSYNGNAGHVIPVDHMYFNFRHTDPNDFTSPTLPTTVLSPGNLEIFQVKSVTYINNSTKAVTGHDYTLYMAPCKEVTVYLGHIDTISQTIQSAVDQATGDKKYCQPDNVMDGTIFRSCTYAMLLNVKAGDQIGAAGGSGISTMAFDFGVYDMRIKSLPFIDQKYWTTQNLHTVCGLNYYPNGAVKTAQFQKVKNTKLANGLPDCGTNMWDKAGTIQGNWVLPGTPTGPVPDQPGLAIVPYNNDPSQGDLDWGGTIAPADRILFKMVSSGIINRDPSQVTPDGKIYCYDSSTYNGRIVLQLADTNTLKIERQRGSCPASPSFTNPTTYVR